MYNVRRLRLRWSPPAMTRQEMVRGGGYRPRKQPLRVTGGRPLPRFPFSVITSYYTAGMKAIRKPVALALIAAGAAAGMDLGGVVMLAAIGARCCLATANCQDDAVARMLREPESVDRSFDDAMAIIRARLGRRRAEPARPRCRDRPAQADHQCGA